MVCSCDLLLWHLFFFQEKMADALNQRRALAMQAVDHFTDTCHTPLFNYIQAVRKRVFLCF